MDEEAADYVEWAYACAHVNRIEDEKKLEELYEFIHLVNTHWAPFRPGKAFTPLTYYFVPILPLPGLQTISFKMHRLVERDYGILGFSAVPITEKTLLENLLLALYDLAEYSKQKFLHKYGQS